MRPIPVTDDMLARHFPPGAVRRVWAAPGGDLTDPVIPPAEAVTYQVHPEGAPPGTIWYVTSVVCAIEDGELDRLHAGGKILLGFPGPHLPVFMVPEVLEP